MMATNQSIGVRSGLALACLCAVLFGAVPDASGDSFTVNSTIDSRDANPGDGICATSAGLGSVCTLRAAVEETNALPGADIINVPAGTYKLAAARWGGGDAGALEIVASEVRICGAGADVTIIDGGGIDRVLQIRYSDVTMCRLTIQHGNTELFGGGIYNFSSRLEPSRVPAKQESGTISAYIERDETSSRANVRRIMPRTSEDDSRH